MSNQQALGNVGSKKVLVLVMTYREKLSHLERISLKQCLSVLSAHPIAIVKPNYLDISQWADVDANIGIEEFDDRYFINVGTYSRLLLSKEFYKRFEQYEYILIHQLDAFVFRDELLAWCETGYDYIGAPWFEGFSHANTKANFIAGGNGGFSLRKVSTHLKVLQSFSYINRPAENWKLRVEQRPSGKNLFVEFAGFLLDMTVRNNTFHALNSFKGYEDQFWCLVAARNFGWFKIPDHLTEMKFAMEMQPARLYELNDRKLPFGCHAWWKYQFDFWKPFISSFGYQLTEKNLGDD